MVKSLHDFVYYLHNSHITENSIHIIHKAMKEWFYLSPGTEDPASESTLISITASK